jgi:hypothetical protein
VALPTCMRSRLQPTCHHAAVLASVQKLLYMYLKLSKLQLVLFVRLLCFWTLSVVLFLFKTHNVSETGFCLRPLVEPTHLTPTDRARPYLFNLELILSVDSGFCSNRHKSTQIITLWLSGYLYQSTVCIHEYIPKLFPENNI